MYKCCDESGNPRGENLLQVPMLSLLVAALLVALSTFVLARRQRLSLTKQPIRQIAVLGRPRRGKLLRDLAAQARTDYPGQSEEWYWRKAQRDLKRYRG